jgi:hypothetical protein
LGKGTAACVTGASEDVIIAAHRFAMHAMMCEVCSADGKEVCEAGLELLKDFQSALNDNAIKDKPRHDA